MYAETFGDGDPLVWVMGWGNVVDSRHERWFADRLVDAGYRVHALELPTNDPDFEGAYVAPFAEYLDGLDDPAIIAHPMGGLTTAHVAPETRVVYLSPWWGMDDDLPAIASLLFKLPTTRRFISNPSDPAALGGLATEADSTSPDRISPQWITAMRRAHETLPPIDDDIVFYTPADTVVDPSAIRAHTNKPQRRTYEGGHELFASEFRDGAVERVVAELDTD